jgi:NitT/TauT family transport system substrate-binding protein
LVLLGLAVGPGRSLQSLRRRSPRSPWKRPPAICIAPEYVAADLLRAEGFTDIRYRARDADTTLELAHNQVDWTFVVAPNLIANGERNEEAALNSLDEAERELKT